MNLVFGNRRIRYEKKIPKSNVRKFFELLFVFSWVSFLKKSIKARVLVHDHQCRLKNLAMKFFVVFVVLFAASSSSPTPSVYVAPGEVNFDTQDKFLDEFKAVSRLSDTQKIATGAPGKKGEYPELCYFTVTFYQKIQRCGCFIVNDKYVATAARCVKECV